MNFFCTNFDVIRQLSDELRRQADNVFVFESLLPKIAEQAVSKKFVVDRLSALVSLLPNCIERVCHRIHLELSMNEFQYELGLTSLSNYCATGEGLFHFFVFHERSGGAML